MIISELNYLETISESPILGGGTLPNYFWEEYLVLPEIEVAKSSVIFTDDATGEIIGAANSVSAVSTDGRFVFAAASASTFAPLPSPSSYS
jgi:hypothetical protein